jgi:hypothetical protein
MPSQDRYLQFNNMNQGEPVVSRCSSCNREFNADPYPGERMGDVIQRLRTTFEAHRCEERDSTKRS